MSGIVFLSVKDLYHLQVCIKEQPMVVADNTQITTRSLITSSSSVSAFISEGIASSSAQLNLSPSITTTPFTGYEITFLISAFTITHHLQIKLRKYKFLSDNFNHDDSINQCSDYCYIIGTCGVSCLHK